MSLVQRSEQKLTDVISKMPGEIAPTQTGRVVGTIDFRQLARRAALPATAPASTAGAAPVAAAQPSRESALELLSEVSSALPAVLARCESLEAALATAKERNRAELEAANEVIRKWQGIAEGMRTQLESAEKAAAAFRSRAEMAEAELAETRGDYERAQQAAAEAECLSSLFQDKVMAAFGVGTPGHSILESVRNRTQQMLSA